MLTPGQQKDLCSAIEHSAGLSIETHTGAETTIVYSDDQKEYTHKWRDGRTVVHTGPEGDSADLEHTYTFRLRVELVSIELVE